MEEMTFGARSSGLGAKLASLEAEDYLYFGLGAFTYYYFAKESLHPSRKSGSKPEGQAAFAGAKLMGALLFYRALKGSGLIMDGRVAAFATIAGAVGLEWYLRKDHPALPPAVGWGYGNEWESVWDEHRSYLEPNFWEQPGW